MSGVGGEKTRLASPSSAGLRGPVRTEAAMLEPWITRGLSRRAEGSGHRPLYRLQTLRRSFWDDRAWVPLKMILLAALVVAAALL